MLGTGVPRLEPWFIGSPPSLPASDTVFGSAFGQPAAPVVLGSSPQVQKLVQIHQPVDVPQTAETRTPESIADLSSAGTATNRPLSENEGAMSSTFDVTERYDIPSDGSFHKVTMVVSIS